MHPNPTVGPPWPLLIFRFRDGLAGDEEGSRGREGNEGTGETGLLPTYKLYALNEIYG